MVVVRAVSYFMKLVLGDLKSHLFLQKLYKSSTYTSCPLAIDLFFASHVRIVFNTYFDVEINTSASNDNILMN